MSDEIIIRPASSDDVGTIHRLLGDLARSIGAGSSYQSTPQDLHSAGFTDPPAYFALVAERGGEGLGLALYFYTFSTWRGRRGVYIQDLHVVETERGSGLGRRLVEAVAAHARRDGCTHLRLAVALDNKKARGFYKKLGFTECADEMACQIDDDKFSRMAEGVMR